MSVAGSGIQRLAAGRLVLVREVRDDLVRPVHGDGVLPAPLLRVKIASEVRGDEGGFHMQTGRERVKTGESRSSRRAKRASIQSTRLLSEGVSADNEREVWRQDTGLGPWVGKKDWLSGLRLFRAAFPSRLCASGIQGRTELGNANTPVLIGPGCCGAPRLGSCVFGATQF